MKTEERSGKSSNTTAIDNSMTLESPTAFCDYREPSTSRLSRKLHSTCKKIKKKKRKHKSCCRHSKLIFRMELKGHPGLKKMLAVMSEESAEQCRDVTKDFLTTGRVGRRNALPDILGEHARLSTAELPDQMSCLTVADDSNKNQPNQSTSQAAPNTHAASGSMQGKS